MSAEIFKQFANSQRDDARSFATNIRKLAHEYRDASKANAHDLTVAIKNDIPPSQIERDVQISDSAPKPNVPILAVVGIILALAMVAK